MEIYVGVDLGIASPAAWISCKHGDAVVAVSHKPLPINASQDLIVWEEKINRLDVVSRVVDIADRIDLFSDAVMTMVYDLWRKSKTGPADIHINLEDLAYSAHSGSSLDLAMAQSRFIKQVTDGGYDLRVTAPTSLKKFTTGKGNAKKPEMTMRFCDQVGLDPLVALTPMGNVRKPWDDIADAFWLCKMEESLV